MDEEQTAGPPTPKMLSSVRRLAKDSCNSRVSAAQRAAVSTNSYVDQTIVPLCSNSEYHASSFRLRGTLLLSNDRQDHVENVQRG